MYFDRRLFGMTRGVRGRMALAALVGLAAVPIAMWRLTLTGQAMARVFTGEPFDALVGMLVLIAGLIVLRALLQFARDEIANATAALMKARVRARAVRARAAARRGPLRSAPHRRRRPGAGRRRRAARPVLRPVPAAAGRRRPDAADHLRLHGLPRPADGGHLPGLRAADAGHAGGVPPLEQHRQPRLSGAPRWRWAPTSSTTSRAWRR